MASLAGPRPPRKKIFISYHHHGDQAYYKAFYRKFVDALDVVYDNSLGRAIDSDDVDYESLSICENNISGSSCTIVLCSLETSCRKYVDWEIKCTLEKEHGIVGINLPSNPIALAGKFNVPARLNDNIRSGYAIWTNWAYATRSIENLKALIELAVSRPANLIVNHREIMSHNLSPPWRKGTR